MEKIYVFGHKKPDTDSISGTLALTYLKNKLGINAEARSLGDINNETKFVLDYFNVEEPKYINDVKLQIKNTNYVKDYYLNEKKSLYDGFNHMNKFNIGILPICNDENKFSGLVALKDIAKYQLSDNLNSLCTSYDNLLTTLDAKEILRFDEEFDINVLAASFKSTTFIESVEVDKNTGLIVGDRHSIIEYAIKNNVKIIILTNSSWIKDEHLELARKNKVNIIKTEYDTFTTSRKIWLANYLYTQKMDVETVCFSEDEDIDEVVDKSKKFRYSNYPVLDKKGNCLGLLRLSDINDANKKKVILVDHNEETQSVDGLDEAEIVEIIDHHKIGTLGTSMPINFRNMPVGSSNTIIYLMYKENNVEIPKEIAGLMLSGIISDTLLFRSPTTTELDKEVANTLATIAQVNLDEYGMNMLKAGSSLKGKTKEDVLFTDFKNFTIDGKKIGIGQITTFDISEIENVKDEYINLINKTAANNEYYIVALFVTDVINNGSYIYYNDNSKEIFELAFDIENLFEGYYIDNCVSRKKQIIPKIIDVLEKK